MKILKESGTYLEEKRKSNQNIAITLLIIGLLTILFFGLGLIFIGISIRFFLESSHYSKGIYGESLVTNSLKTLGQGYYLLNDVNLPESYGNIDHIVLSPNGIFVIESKYYEGNISCYGDKWYKCKEIGEWSYDIESPSKQVKRNAVKLKQFIQKMLKKSIWIEGIVVFTNPIVELELNSPKVPVLEIGELRSFIKNNKQRFKFSQQELESIGKTILEHTGY